MFMYSACLTVHFLRPYCQPTAVSKHTIKKSSCKEFIWYGVWVTVAHSYTQNTFSLSSLHSVYWRKMCFDTFTDLTCPFLSPAETFHETFPEVSYLLSDILSALPFNDRLQTHQTTLKSFHTLIPNLVSNKFHFNFLVDMQHTLL